ncbi:MAG TPA: hypothetical protein VG845_01310 [Dehalococcoidia bacterium]|jgi:hypothetical protein|nr:hypothetical protein [Dehalococcoidia bacterium]
MTDLLLVGVGVVLAVIVAGVVRTLWPRPRPGARTEREGRPLERHEPTLEDATPRDEDEGRP